MDHGELKAEAGGSPLLPPGSENMRSKERRSLSLEGLLRSWCRIPVVKGRQQLSLATACAVFWNWGDWFSLSPQESIESPGKRVSVRGCLGPVSWEHIGAVVIVS